MPSFDIYTLVFFGLAIFVGLKLRSILGDKIEDEDNTTSGKKFFYEANKKEIIEKEIIDVELEEKMNKLIFSDENIKVKIETISQKYPQFSIHKFVKGSQKAYELIIDNFSQGNIKELKKLTSQNVFEVFNRIIEERIKREETMYFSFIGIEKSEILEINEKESFLEIKVKFIAEMISYTASKEKEVVEGNDKKIKKVTDIWTFSKDMNAKDNVWLLVSTL